MLQIPLRPLHQHINMGLKAAASKSCELKSTERGSKRLQLAAALEFTSDSTCPFPLHKASLTWEQPKSKTLNPLTCVRPFSVGWPSPKTGKPGTCRQLGRGSGVPTCNRKCLIYKQISGFLATIWVSGEMSQKSRENANITKTSLTRILCHISGKME